MSAHSEHKYITTTDDLQLLPSQFYIFSYGPTNMSDYCNLLSFNTLISLKTISDNTLSYTANGWKMMFFSNFKSYKGSCVTIERKSDSSVYGIIIKMSMNSDGFKIGEVDVNFKKLMSNENFGTRYVIRCIGNHVDDTKIYSFVRNPYYKYNHTETVAISYLIRICSTQKDRRKILSLNLHIPYVIEIVYMFPNGVITQGSIIRFSSVEVT